MLAQRLGNVRTVSTGPEPVQGGVAIATQCNPEISSLVIGEFWLILDVGLSIQLGTIRANLYSIGASSE